MPDENRVFDVTKPKDVSPPATSKPVIVGHHPETSDPMVKESDMPSEEATHIKVIDDSHDNDAAESKTAADIPEPSEHPALNNSPVPPEAAAIFSDPASEHVSAVDKPEADDSMPGSMSEEKGPEHNANMEPSTFPEAPSTEPADEPAPPDDRMPAAPAETASPPPHIEELHFSEKNIKRSWWKPALLVIVLLLIAAYLAIDSGLIASGIKLPFHIFKQPVTTTSSNKTTPPAASQTTATTPSIPTAFKSYQLSGTNLTFAAPLAWGAPASTTDPGYSKRGTGQQSDGTHAYLVNFASNKDIQLAITSSKYLPPSRGALYYDYLQWCTGTNDGQYYYSELQFATSSGIDTPTTVVCNQGPVTNITKINSKTIVQTRATDTADKLIGDIYVENLNDPNLVVIRAKDFAMTNGDAIKQLLGTVRFSASQ